MKHAIFLSVFLWVLYSCKTSPDQLVKLEGCAQTTTYHLIYSDREGRSFQPEIDSLLQAVDSSLSRWSANARLARINAGDTSVLTDLFLEEAFRKGVEVAEKTAGAFDFTIGSQLNALGFGADTSVGAYKDKPVVPANFHKVKLINHHLIILEKGLQLNFDALADGYAVDLIAALLEEKGVQHYSLELGGEVRCKGTDATGKPWIVELENPDTTFRTVSVSLRNRAASTSGNYRNFKMINGKKVGHIIDPHTGTSPENSLISVTVFAKDCITADALSTAFMVLGFEKSLTIVKEDPDLDAYFIFSSKSGKTETYATPGISGLIPTSLFIMSGEAPFCYF